MALTCTETRSLDKFPYHKVDFEGYKIAMCIQWRIFIIFYNDDFVWLTDYDYVVCLWGHAVFQFVFIGSSSYQFDSNSC